MNHTRASLFLAIGLLLSSCAPTGEKLPDAQKTLEELGQPDIKSLNDTQEQMAKDALAAGELQRASQFYELLIASPKSKPEQLIRYKLGMADAMRRLGNNDRALAMYDQLVKENPKNIDALEGQGLTLMAAGKSVDASRAFSAVVEKDPKRWRTLNALGILFVTKNMIPEAMAYYTEALKYSADNPAVLNNVGLSQAVDHNFQRGLDALDQAFRLSKSAGQRKQIELNMALVYATSGDLDRAKEITAKYYDGAALDNNMGLYAHLAKDDKLAKTYLNMALSQSTTFYERAWSNLDVVNDASTGTRDDTQGNGSVQKPANRSAK